MNIGCLILGSLFKIGGYQVFAYNLMKQLISNGHRIQLVLAQKEFDANRDLYRRSGFSIATLKFASDRLINYLPILPRTEIKLLQNRENFDVWQIVGAYPAGYIARGLGREVPLVLRTHGEDVQVSDMLGYGLRRNTVLNDRIIDTLLKMDKVIALTKSMADDYLNMGILPHKIEVIPNGVSVDSFSGFGRQKKSRLLPDDVIGKPLLLTVGRYHLKKGYEYIPDIAAHLVARGLDFRWLIVGKDVNKIDEAIRHHNLESYVITLDEIGVDTGGIGTFSMPNEELVEVYMSGDVFVFPSLLEGFPRVVIEAMAAGLPVVTTDAEGCKDVVEHGHTGLISPAADSELMAKNIEILLCNKSMRKTLSDSAKESAKRYEWSKITNRYEDVYRSVLEGV